MPNHANGEGHVSFSFFSESLLLLYYYFKIDGLAKSNYI